MADFRPDLSTADHQSFLVFPHLEDPTSVSSLIFITIQQLTLSAIFSELKDERSDDEDEVPTVEKAKALKGEKAN